MSEQKKQEKPLEDVDVQVQAQPQTGEEDAARSVKKKVTEQIKKVVEKNASGGAKKQLDAADEELEEVAKKVSPRAVRKLIVSVKGKVDGDSRERKREITPKEGEKD